MTACTELEKEAWWGDVEAASTETLIATILALSDGDAVATQRARRTAARLIHDFGGVGGLARSTTSEIAPLFAREKARRPTLAARALVAAFELTRRVSNAEARPPSRIMTNEDVFAWARPRLTNLDTEELWLLALDRNARIRGVRCVARGGTHGVGARVSDVARAAVRLGASGFILVHNHPSGNATPSPEDVAFTDAIREAALIVGVPLLDHVVVTRDAFCSVAPAARESSG